MTYTVETLAREQQDLLLDRFDYDFAWRLGSRMRELAAERRAPVSVTVAHGADLVFAALMPGATPDNSDWAARKRAVAHRFHRSSLSLRLEAEEGGFDFNDRYRLPASDFVASGGGVPLAQRNGILVGTAGVSGLPDVDGHLLVVHALRFLLDHNDLRASSAREVGSAGAR
jgi:uncharacterized protein (UPF0303 family)